MNYLQEWTRTWMCTHTTKPVICLLLILCSYAEWSLNLQSLRPTMPDSWRVIKFDMTQWLGSRRQTPPNCSIWVGGLKGCCRWSCASEAVHFQGHAFPTSVFSVMSCASQLPTPWQSPKSQLRLRCWNHSAHWNAQNGSAGSWKVTLLEDMSLHSPDINP